MKKHISVFVITQNRKLFGELLAEIQRIKFEGDYALSAALVENYGEG